MLDLVTTTQFRKGLKKLRKRGADIQNWMMSCKCSVRKNNSPKGIGIMLWLVITLGFANATSCRTGYSYMPSTKEN